MNKKLISLLLSLFAFSTFSNTAFADEERSPIWQVSDEWRFTVDPYAWVPMVSVTTSNANGKSGHAGLTINDVINNLKSGGMITGEAHYGNWGLMADSAMATLQKDGGFTFNHIKASDKATLQASLVTGAVTYTVFNTKDAYVDALVGARWMSLTSTLDISSGPYNVSASSPMHTTDVIGGFKGRYRIMDSSWYIPFYADYGVGGGPNNMTWQASVGIGKAVSKMVDVSLIYRTVYFDINSGPENSSLLKGTFHGPQIKATFNY